MAPETLFSTLLTLLPTERIEAMAATAISEAISVYSIAVAPRWSFARRRKMDNITILPKSSGAAAGTRAGNLPIDSVKESYLRENLQVN